MKAIDRFYEYINLMGKKPVDIELAMNLGNGYFGKMKKRGGSIGSDILEKIVYWAPELNLDWLLTGKGFMIKAPYLNGVEDIEEKVQPKVQPIVQPIAKKEPETPVFQMSEPSVDYLSGKNTRVLAITQDSRGIENVELVQTKAAASYIDNIQEPEFLTKLPKLSIPSIQLRGGTFRGFEVKGDSMEPTLQPGSIVVGRFVDNWLNDIKEDWIYIVVTKEAIMIKRVLNRIEARMQLRLKSDNYLYEAINIDIADVQELWFLKAELRYNFKNTGKELYNQVQHHEAEIQSLKEDMELVRINGGFIPPV